MSGGTPPRSDLGIKWRSVIYFTLRTFSLPKQMPRLLARAQMSTKVVLELVLKKDKNHFPLKEYKTERPSQPTTLTELPQLLNSKR